MQLMRLLIFLANRVVIAYRLNFVKIMVMIFLGREVWT